MTLDLFPETLSPVLPEPARGDTQTYPRASHVAASDRLFPPSLA